MLAKLNKLTNWQAALVIAILGFAVFSIGLTNPFEGDDLLQIVNNIPVHSISNIQHFFEGGTIYSGTGTTQLNGMFYRPLMTTVFSAMYSFFGPHPVYFHLLQLLLCIGSAIMLFLFFRYSFSAVLALVLALIFLVHPINSQIVYAIPTMQDALYFFFGILAMWMLLRFKSQRSLFLVALCLLLSLFSKESGLLFVGAALLYLFWWDRKRLLPFVGIVALPLVLYFALKIHATGLSPHPHNGPIDTAGLTARLFTAPSIFLFYLVKFIFPVKLATLYHWVYPNFSFSHFLLPLIVDVAVLLAIIYLSFVIKRRVKTGQYYTYLYFAIWFIAGLVVYLQLVPLDMTACETWFYFPIVGALGLIGVIVTAFKRHIRPNWFWLVAAILVGMLGFRSALRGLDYRSEYILTKHDIAASKEDYYAYTYQARTLIKRGKYAEAEPYTEKSINIFPMYQSFNDLGLILTGLNNYVGAGNAYAQALKNTSPDTSYQMTYTYEQIAPLMIVYPNTTAAADFYSKALTELPKDCVLWQDRALFEQKHSGNIAAKSDISTATHYCQVGQSLYDGIMNNQTFYLQLKTKQIVKI